MSKLGPNDKVEAAAATDDDSDDLLKFPLSFLILITILWILFCAWIFTFFENEWGYGKFANQDFIYFFLKLSLCKFLICMNPFSCKIRIFSGTSLYFTLISFLTIGFGDVLPSKSDYIILIGILLLIGLALVSTLLQIIQKQIETLATVNYIF